ncbi:30S ribosomal protein S9 [bacterium]|nr:30S ribosomal protein S9 [bacterium]
MADVTFWGTGRRKTAVAQVRLKKGSGKILVNNRAFENYFPVSLMQKIITQPLVVTETLGKFDVFAKISGGGSSGQAGAFRHGIARALVGFNGDLRKALRQTGLLTRDPRMRERKKYGLKRARKRPQYSKR